VSGWQVAGFQGFQVILKGGRHSCLPFFALNPKSKIQNSKFHLESNAQSLMSNTNLQSKIKRPTSQRVGARRAVPLLPDPSLIVHRKMNANWSNALFLRLGLEFHAVLV